MRWGDAKGLDAEAVQMLVTCNWPLLKSLTLHLLTHDVTACHRLASNTWSVLEVLDLSGVCLDKQAALALTAPKWSRLKELKLSAWSVQDHAMAILADKEWPQLRSLEVQSTIMLPSSIEQLTKLQVGVLEKLVLADCGLTAECIALLVQAEWPLKELELSGHSYWNQDGLAKEYWQLGNANWPYLQKLTVSGALYLDGTCVSYLTRANMARLEELILQVPFLSGRTPVKVPSEELTEGNWPLLKHLILYGMRFDSESTSRLIDKWPRLHITV